LKPLTILKNWLKSSARPRGVRVNTIVLHATAGKSAASSIRYMRLPEVAASYHYIIERDGEVTKCVPVERKAWHAGKSVGPEGSDVNRYSIGIAFANLNDGNEVITAKQWDAARSLCIRLKEAYPIEWVVTHYGISYPRKTDPRGFNLELFAKGLAKVKTWYKPGSPNVT
jgi:N-acetylmuramoyl-L-alanine amidase